MFRFPFLPALWASTRYEGTGFGLVHFDSFINLLGLSFFLLFLLKKKKYIYIYIYIYIFLIKIGGKELKKKNNAKNYIFNSHLLCNADVIVTTHNQPLD
jgi:hypothetical protein